MRFREIQELDIPALFKVRVATRENSLSREDLRLLGITEESVKSRLGKSHKGWLCEEDGAVVGFAIGDRSTGELWVIAVLPAYERKGIGSRLLTMVEEWLCESGCSRFWLTTDVDMTLDAYSFYRQHGWMDDRVEGGLRYMVKNMQTDAHG